MRINIFYRALVINNLIIGNNRITRFKILFVTYTIIQCITITRAHVNVVYDTNIHGSRRPDVWLGSCDLCLCSSANSISTCWYVLLSGSVLVKEHMYLARCWYVPHFTLPHVCGLTDETCLTAWWSHDVLGVGQWWGSNSRSFTSSTCLSFLFTHSSTRLPDGLESHVN